MADSGHKWGNCFAASVVIGVLVLGFWFYCFPDLRSLERAAACVSLVEISAVVACISSHLDHPGAPYGNPCYYFVIVGIVGVLAAAMVYNDVLSGSVESCVIVVIVPAVILVFLSWFRGK